MTYHANFSDNLGALSNAQLRLQFNELEDRIYNGHQIPDDYYRLDLGRNRDRLLHEKGVKHLHLGGRASNFLVYLIELEDRVIFLRIDDHALMEDEPRGDRLMRLLGLLRD